MSVRTPLLLAVVVACGLAAGCRTQPEPPAPAPVPSADQIRDDLGGRRFTFYEDDEGAREWTIGTDEVRGLRIVDSTRAAGGRRLRVRVALTLAAENRTIRGQLALDYVAAETGWRLAEVDRAGPNFAAGDRSATLFDVQIQTDSVTSVLALDVIAGYEDGAYTDPFAPFRDRVRAAFDSTFETDSLREVTVRGLEREIAGRWVRRGQEVRGLAPGRAGVPIRIDSAEASVDGCQFLAGFARPPGGAERLWMATTSTVMGGARSPGRPLSGEEVRHLDRLARERLAAHGLRADRLQDAGATAADLSGDGTEELIGVYAIPGRLPGQGRGLLVVARDRTDGAELVTERTPDAAAGFERFVLVGVVDVDSDGANELILREEGVEMYRYLIVTYRNGRFTDAFRGGGGGC